MIYYECASHFYFWEKIMSSEKIVFNKPYWDQDSMKKATEVASNMSFSSTELDAQILKTLVMKGILTPEHCVYYTQSATQSLEIMALALGLKAGDEVIMPSYTYAATANAFARTGAKLVFAEVDLNTVNITPETVLPLITDKTRAIMPIHYGGGAADVEGLIRIANQNNAHLLEDAAHGVGAKYKGHSLGTFGALGCFSFHHTKNITAFGNGGLLIMNKHSKFHGSIEQIYYQGTDRGAFLRGEASEYRWMMLGGEYEMPLFNKAYLSEAFKNLNEVTAKRKSIWNYYQNTLSTELSEFIENAQLILPRIIDGAEINGHIYHIILPSKIIRNRFIQRLSERSIAAYSHYEPLHLSPAGQKYGEVRTPMQATESIGKGLVRLPLYYDLSLDTQQRIVETVIDTIRAIL